MKQAAHIPGVRSKSQRSWRVAPRIVFAVAVSLFLHVGMLALATRMPTSAGLVPVEPTPLSARLLPRGQDTPALSDGLIKNTLPPQEAQTPPVRKRAREAAPRERPEKPAGEPIRRPAVDYMQQRIAEIVLYPPEALERGLEGEVIVLLDIDTSGHVSMAAVASSSGHAVLDEAALRAVRAIGTLSPAVAGRTILLPVRFRLH